MRTKISIFKTKESISRVFWKGSSAVCIRVTFGWAKHYLSQLHHRLWDAPIDYSDTIWVEAISLGRLSTQPNQRACLGLEAIYSKDTKKQKSLKIQRDVWKIPHCSLFHCVPINRKHTMYQSITLAIQLRDCRWNKRRKSLLAATREIISFLLQPIFQSLLSSCLLFWKKQTTSNVFTVNKSWSQQFIPIYSSSNLLA